MTSLIFYESRLPNEWQRERAEVAHGGLSVKISSSSDERLERSAHLTYPPLLVPAGVEDVHFHPLEPRMVRFTGNVRL